MTGKDIRKNFVKAPDTGAHLLHILTFEEYYGDRVNYSVFPMGVGHAIKMDLPTPYNGNLLQITKKDLGFFRI